MTGHAHVYPHTAQGWGLCECGAALDVTWASSGPPDIGDGFASQTRQAQDYAALLLHERETAIRAHDQLVQEVENLRLLLTDQKHDDAGYALACRDIAGLLAAMLGSPS